MSAATRSYTQAALIPTPNQSACRCVAWDTLAQEGGAMQLELPRFRADIAMAVSS
jgi:hypothetical protein